MKFLGLGFVALALIFLQCKKEEKPQANNVRISILDLSVNEGQEYANIAVQLQLDGAADQQITAYVSTGDGTAESNKDFVPLNNQTVVFAAGETSKTVEITIAGDLILEDDEFFQASILNVDGPATILNTTARIDILNDDVAGVQDVAVSPICDWAALLNLAPGSEPSYSVMNFGQPSNVPNAEFTSVAAVNDMITFNPTISSTGDTILYYELTFDDPMFNPEEYFEDLSDWSDSVGVDAKLLVINSDVNDLEVKYSLWFYIGKADGKRIGPFVIDPKIRIPSQ